MTFWRLNVRATAAMAVLALATAGDRVVAQQSAPRTALLARTASLAAPRSLPPLDPWERRSRLVAPNTGALPNRAIAGQAPGSASEISIDLFDGASVTAVFDRFDPNDTGVTWIGHVPGQPGSQVTVVQGGGALAASIILPHASYTIRPAPLDPGDPSPIATVHVMSEINGSGFQSEAQPLIPEITREAVEVAADTVMEDSAEFIDVLIVYTASAENWAGGASGIINWINLGISETNSAYATSGVGQRVRLAHVQRVAYTEVGNFGTNLNNLRAGAIGLETVAALRNLYSADLVSMLVRPLSPTACGIAFLMTTVSTAFAPNGYSVVDSPCMSPNGTLAHEFGHNMGLRHDWFMDNGITPYTYAHGHVNVAAGFRTIMSYPNGCAGCARMLAFSNPDITFLGVPMGVREGTSIACPTGNSANMSCDADERRALNNTAFSVANFRQFSDVRPPVIRSQPQNQSVPRGQPLTLQVVAEGLGPFTYQWYRGAAPMTSRPVAGATGPAYTFVPGDDGVWSERWFYWVQVTNSIGPVNSLTATVTLLQPSSDPGAPQRSGIVARDTARAPSPAARDVSTAGPRTRPSVPGAPAPSAAPGGIISHSGSAGPRESLPTPDASEEDLRCAAARMDAAIAWTMLSRGAHQRAAIADALADLTRALVTLDDPVCRGAGTRRH